MKFNAQYTEVSQVFQIALMHIPPYPFNTFGNKIQNLNVKDGKHNIFITALLQG